MKKFRLPFLCVATFLIHSLNASADIRLPAIISDHMVLQQNTQVKIWGWSDADELVTLKTSWDTNTYSTRGSSLAKWMLEIKTPAAGGPYSITLKGYNSVTIDDILIGEVWDCSGQSNMEMSYNWGVKEYSSEAENANDKQIRFFHIPRLTAAYPQDDTKAKWVVCNPDDMKKFSLVGYFFGQHLQQTLQVPVGLINASWGGTPAEAWSPEEDITQDSILRQAAQKLKPNKGWPVVSAATYNAMIHPIINFNIAGVIWYQGEANVEASATYTRLLSNMIQSWRKAWQKDLPFYYVQIAPFSYGDNLKGPLLREAQTSVSAVPNTGMVVIHDLVPDVHDIHPHNKKGVGLRLANYALAVTYGIKGLNYKSPQYKSVTLEKNKLRVSFTNADNGLVSRGDTLTEFFIAGEDKVFMPAMAKIEGNTVVVWNKNIKTPIAVRFGFSNTAMPNLFSKEGLPVNIFRTDKWDDVMSAK